MPVTHLHVKAAVRVFKRLRLLSRQRQSLPNSHLLGEIWVREREGRRGGTPVEAGNVLQAWTLSQVNI